MSVTVLTRASATKLTTLEHVRSDLGQAIGQADDQRIERFIETASARAASFCRRTFGRETVRERFVLRDGDFGRTTGGLLLSCTPVVSVASVQIDGVALDSGEYEADGRLLSRLQDGRRCRWSGYEIAVEYIAGWFLPGESGDPPAGVERLPADIEQAVIQLVGVALSAASRDPMVRSESEDGVGSTTWYVQGANAALPHPEAEAILMQYRRVFLG